MPRRPRSLVFHAAVSTLGPIGHFGRGSGTLGAIASLPLAYWVAYWPSWVRIVGVVALTIATTISAHIYVRTCLEKDPQQIIIDEFIGCLIAVAFAPTGLAWLLAGFTLFRVLDIFKPWPISRCESIEGGVGVMADDIVAGIVAAAALCLIALLI